MLLGDGMSKKKKLLLKNKKRLLQPCMHTKKAQDVRK
jgi:hypothetical protein